MKIETLKQIIKKNSLNEQFAIITNLSNGSSEIFKIGSLEKIIREVDENLIQNVSTFDVYEGENIPKDKKSVAINVTLQAIDKTLSEKDLDEISKKIIDTVGKKTGATIRS